MRTIAVALLTLSCLSAHAAGWTYTTKKDAMTDQVARVATLKSPTRVTLGAPYGATSGELVVNAAGGHAERIRLIVSRGQLLESEGLVLRINDDAPLQLRAVTAADGSAQFLSIAQVEFMEHPDLAERIAAASRLRVQATFYDNGEKVFEFKPAGLKLE